MANWTIISVICSTIKHRRLKRCLACDASGFHRRCLTYAEWRARTPLQCRVVTETKTLTPFRCCLRFGREALPCRDCVVMAASEVTPKFRCVLQSNHKLQLHRITASKLASVRKKKQDMYDVRSLVSVLTIIQSMGLMQEHFRTFILNFFYFCVTWTRTVSHVRFPKHSYNQESVVNDLRKN